MGEIASVLLPVLLCVGVGALWRRAGRPFDRGLMTLLIADVGAPCLVFSRLVALDVEPEALGRMAAAAATAMACFAALGAAALRASGQPLHTWLAPLVFVNAGNMGLPVCLFAFGEEGLALALVWFAMASVAQFTLGPPLWSGHWGLGPWLRTPVVPATALAVAWRLGEWPVPAWLLRTTTLLGDFAVPLMLLTLGVALAELRVPRLGRPAALAGLRLALGVGVGAALVPAFGLAGVDRGVFLLQCAMPAAVFNHLFAERYGRAPDEIAGLVVLSTLLGFVSLPFLLRWAFAG